MKFLIFLTIFINFLNAEILVNNKYNYYEVDSKNDYLANRIIKLTPVIINNNRFAAYTENQINWNIRFNYINNSCRITKINLYLNNTFTLPKLNYQNTSLEDIKRYEQWFPKLKQHEENHAYLGYKVAQEIEERMLSLRKSNCKNFLNYANKEGTKVYQNLRNYHNNYDNETDHGTTEGARLGDYY